MIQPEDIISGVHIFFCKLKEIAKKSENMIVAKITG